MTKRPWQTADQIIRKFAESHTLLAGGAEFDEVCQLEELCRTARLSDVSAWTFLGVRASDIHTPKIGGSKIRP